VLKSAHPSHFFGDNMKRKIIELKDGDLVRLNGGGRIMKVAENGSNLRVVSYAEKIFLVIMSPIVTIYELLYSDDTIFMKGVAAEDYNITYEKEEMRRA
jgi:hypothetical protein